MSSVSETKTNVANLALAHCGVSKPMADIQTEKSLEAQLCRTFFDISRQYVLREFNWFFATKQINPSLIVTQPTPEWMYAYQYPSDALKITRFMSWRLSNDTRQSRIEYTVMQPVTNALSTISPTPSAYAQTTGMWIYTNWPGPNSSLPTIIEYIFDNENVSQWTPDFVIALSYKLASFIVMTLTTGDPQKYMEGIESHYVETVSRAKADNLNEQQRPEDPQSEFIRARDGEIQSATGQTWSALPTGFDIQ